MYVVQAVASSTPTEGDKKKKAAGMSKEFGLILIGQVIALWFA